MNPMTKVNPGGLGNGCFAEDETGDVHAFEESVSGELQSRGVLFQQNGHWRIRRADIGVIEHRYPDLAICDFCASRPVTWDVDCASFTDAAGNISVGGWAACEACGMLIDTNDRAGLLARATEKYRKRGTFPDLIVSNLLAENQRRFWQHYKSCKRIAPHPFGH